MINTEENFADLVYIERCGSRPLGNDCFGSSSSSSSSRKSSSSGNSSSSNNSSNNSSNSLCAVRNDLIRLADAGEHILLVSTEEAARRRDASDSLSVLFEFEMLLSALEESTSSLLRERILRVLSAMRESYPALLHRALSSVRSVCTRSLLTQY